jgi:ABC-2 type transport system permease protein
MWSNSIRRIRHLIRKEVLQFVRNKQNVRMLIAAPIIQLFLFGYAARLDVHDVSTAVVDLDRSALSREVIGGFEQSGYFRINYMPATYDEADRLLERGLVSVAILIPPDLERRTKAERTAQVGIRIDGVDTTVANTVSGYSQSILQAFSLKLLQQRIDRAIGLRYQTGEPDLLVPDIRVQSRAWFNPELDSLEFFVPGVLTMVLTFFSVMLTAQVLVREKEVGTIEQLMVSPITSLELILGKTIPCFAVSLINLITVTGLALLWFQPTFRGSLLFFGAYSMLYLITCLSLGITISAFCRTQQQAVLSSFLVLQPASILSGFAFPIANMPVIIQYITFLNPLRYYLVVAREVFLKGLGWDILWTQVIPIAIMAIAYIALAAVLFKKRVD